MHKFFTFLNLIIRIGLISIMGGCANISAPTGGPKDITPPKPKQYYPINNTTNFKGNTFTIKFSEKIQDVEDPSQIIVNPLLEKELDVRVKNKRILVVKFQEALKENTTYTINFRNVIKDLTEGNLPTESVQYNLSTGNELDSNSIYGTTIDLLNNRINEKTVIGIYALSDTINIAKHKPLYLTQVDKDGSYEIRNIKNGTYRIVAFTDNNNTALYDSEDKTIDFEDTVKIVGSKKINFKLSKIKRTGLKIVSQKPINKNEYQITLNSGLSYIGSISDNERTFFRKKLSTNCKTISVYNTPNIYKDSIDIKFNCTDSLGFDTIINTKIIYNNDVVKNNTKPIKPKKETLKIIEPNDFTLKSDSQSVNISFSHPIQLFNSNYIKIVYDSLGSIKNEDINYLFNNDSTRLLIKFNAKFKDSLIIYTDNQVFINVLGDSVEKSKNKFLINKRLESGIISGEIKSTKENNILQLLDERFNIIEQQKVKQLFSFKKVRAGKYQLRLIIDNNNNGKWDQGNYNTMTNAEDIFHYEVPINLKADWEINDIVFKIDDK